MEGIDCVLQMSSVAGRAGAAAGGGVAKGVVLAVAHFSAVPAVRVDGTGPVTVMAGVAGLANARSRPRVTPDKGGREFRSGHLH